MSVQFGTWNFDGKPPDRDYFAQVSELTAKYGPDGQSVFFRGSIGMLYRPFHTTRESWAEPQPLMTPTGIILTWDGRLDNRDELMRHLGMNSHSTHTDAGIVLAAYERWAAASFSKLHGDWALAVWNPSEQSLFLAKDFAGVRHLFYRFESHEIAWCTVLDPLLLLGGRTFPISEEFIAGYLSNYPATHLTPYVGINAVRPSTFVQVTKKDLFTHTYWTFDSSRKIRYQTDSEYEEHFRSVFTHAVRRRLRSSHPVLAELSGGMDSASIVCVADSLIEKNTAETPRLDTVSYYDDNEPNWNERPYFSLIEQKRGCEGYHIDVGGTEGAFLPPEHDLFFALPGCDRLGFSRSCELGRCLQASKCRVVLSGIGGDEFLGGVPTPIPELQDLIACLRWVRCGRQLYKFALQQRRPLLHLLLETIEEFMPQAIQRLYKHPLIAPWLTRTFILRFADVFMGDMQRTKLFGAQPSFQASVRALEHLRRQLSCSHLEETANHRVSYPYLDRDLLTFLLSIPRDQLARPGQRRSLMRRALATIVPPQILARKRKAFVARQPLTMFEHALPALKALLQSPFVTSYSWVQKDELWEALSAARRGRTEFMIPLQSVFRLELWLRELVRRNLLTRPIVGGRPTIRHPLPREKVVLPT